DHLPRTYEHAASFELPRRGRTLRPVWNPFGVRVGGLAVFPAGVGSVSQGAIGPPQGALSRPFALEFNPFGVVGPLPRRGSIPERRVARPRAHPGTAVSGAPWEVGSDQSTYPEGV